MWLYAVLAGTFIGTVSELAANLCSLWVYKRSMSALINILAMFGVIMGSVSLLAPITGYWIVAAVGFLIGYGYEIANFLWLHWWEFPHDRFLFFHGRQGCSISVAVLWAIVPVAISLFTGV